MEINPDFELIIPFLAILGSVPSLQKLWKEIYFNKKVVKQVCAM
jgi:hypothetical protein